MSVFFHNKYQYYGSRDDASHALSALEAVLVGEKIDNYDRSQSSSSYYNMHIRGKGNIIRVMSLLLFDDRYGKMFSCNDYETKPQYKREYRQLLVDLMASDDEQYSQPLRKLFQQQLDEVYEKLLQEDGVQLLDQNNALTHQIVPGEGLKHPAYQLIALLCRDEQEAKRKYEAKGFFERLTSGEDRRYFFVNNLIVDCRRLGIVPQVYYTKPNVYSSQSVDYKKILRNLNPPQPEAGSAATSAAEAARASV